MTTEAHAPESTPAQPPPQVTAPAPAPAPARDETKIEIAGHLHAFGDGLILFRPVDGDHYERALTFIRKMKVKTRGRQILALTITRGAA